MAIEIDENNNTGNYNENNLATHGNVVKTIINYNNKVKEEYNDKNDNTLDNNTLQKSLETIVKALDKSNDISGTFSRDVSVELLNSDETTKNDYSNSGLIRRLDILSKAITPLNTDISVWNDSIHANYLKNSSKPEGIAVDAESIENVPVIAKVKIYEPNESKYSTNREFNNSFNINGLETASNQYVLSEKQISDMVIAASREIIEDYSQRLIQLREMVRNNNAKLINILNYIIRTNSDYTDYFPVSVGYHEESQGSAYIRKYYEFITLNSKSIEIDASEFTNNNDRLFLVFNKTTKEITYDNKEISEGNLVSYCNITLTDGKFVVRETVNPEDNGYELLLTNYPIYIIIDSDIDLSTMGYALIVNGNPREVVRQESDISPSNTRNYRYKIELLSLEGQDLRIVIPYTNYKDKEFKEVSFTIKRSNNDAKEITDDYTIDISSGFTEETINIDIYAKNTNNISYFTGFGDNLIKGDK